MNVIELLLVVWIVLSVPASIFIWLLLAANKHQQSSLWKQSYFKSGKRERTHGRTGNQKLV